MKLFVTAKPRAKQEEVIQIDGNHYKVSVKAPPVQSLANEAVEKALALYFNVPASNVRVIKGHTSKKKVVEIII